MSNQDSDRHAPWEVEEYLAEQSPHFGPKLEALRRAIYSVATACTERVSYGVPVFRPHRC